MVLIQTHISQTPKSIFKRHQHLSWVLRREGLVQHCMGNKPNPYQNLVWNIIQGLAGKICKLKQDKQREFNKEIIYKVVNRVRDKEKPQR